MRMTSVFGWPAHHLVQGVFAYEAILLSTDIEHWNGNAGKLRADIIFQHKAQAIGQNLGLHSAYCCPHCIDQRL